MLSEVVDVKQETPDTKTLKLKLDSAISYKSGQFVMTVIEKDGKKVSRAYSIANFPELPTNEILITFNLIPNGIMSTYLYNMKVGDKIEVDGPFGNFNLGEGESFVLIAGGTGIAPIRSMIECLLDKNKEMSLIYSVKTSKDIIYEEELNKLSEEGKINFIPTVTREDNNWEGRKGRIDADLLKSVIKTKNEGFYICGSPEFADSVIGFLKELGIDDKQLHTEKW